MNGMRNYSDMKKIAVVGSGIAGLSAAYYLSKLGNSVTVFDQERYPAMQTSRANGGQISVSNSEVWTTFDNIKRGVQWMFTKDAPLLIRPSLSLHKITWLTKFLWSTLNYNYARNTAETIKLGLENRNLLANLIAEENIQFDYAKSGILHIYKDLKYFDHAISVKELYQANGCTWEIINLDRAIKIEPTLSQNKNIVGAAWTPEDSVGDMHKFCVELTLILKIKYNVTFCFNKHIKNVEELTTEFDSVIIANGTDAHRLAQQLKDKVDIYPVKGYSITIDIDPISKGFCPKTSLLDDQAKIVTSTLGNRLRVAGTAELDGYNRDIRRDRIEPLLSWVKENLPGIDTRNYNQWACLRPMTPDMMPIIKQSRKNNKIWYHCGHGHLGWTLSLATANKLINEMAQS